MQVRVETCRFRVALARSLFVQQLTSLSSLHRSFRLRDTLELNPHANPVETTSSSTHSLLIVITSNIFRFVN